MISPRLHLFSEDYFLKKGSFPNGLEIWEHCHSNSSSGLGITPGKSCQGVGCAGFWKLHPSWPPQQGTLSQRASIFSFIHSREAQQFGFAETAFAKNTSVGQVAQEQNTGKGCYLPLSHDRI